MFDVRRAECVVLDASVLINLVATDIADAILAAMGRPCVVTDDALREVKRCPRGRSNGEHPAASLLASSRLQEVLLSDAERELFFGLVGAAPPDDLDDGEAASIACAHFRNGIIVLDERKARRIAREQFPSLLVLSSVDLFVNALESGVVELVLMRQAVRDAMHYSRMRVLAEQKPWVASLIDAEGKSLGRAAESKG
ncbi:hypothetical protein KYC5002_50005 [Archangium violaceum]|uniref:hypothetical protein n=1 Tax=Archangium violaceum TaxID=83451 RepID=UPI002B316EC7|nr:hypothetical protein KYC5002_50005 [Archangium gephyra]